MDSFILLMCTFLMILTGVIKSATEEHLQQDIGDIIEAEIGRNMMIRFNDSVHMRQYSLSHWKILGPYKSTKCEKSEKILFKHQQEYIRCIENPDSTLTVFLNKFRSHHAGKWIIRKKYRKYGYQNITSTETSFSVLGIEFIEKYHNRTFEMKDGKYFVMFLEKTFDDYSICKLVNKETNTVYDLNAQPIIFSNSKADIKRLSPCGFHMHARNTSHGNWSLIGRSGWIERRAEFQIFINSSRIEPAQENQKAAWFDGLSRGFFSPESASYYEIETPDGNTIILSEDVIINPITAAHNGIWIYRSMEDQSSLEEEIFSVTVLDLLQMTYKLDELDDGLFNLYVGVSFGYISELELRKKDGEIFLGKGDQSLYVCSIRKDITCSSDCETLCAPVRNFLIKDFNLTDSIGAEMEVSFGCEEFHMKALITPDPRVPHGSIQYPSHLWYSVQKKKYVTRQESLEVKCIASAPLTNCTLKNPRNERYILGDNPLMISKNCSKLGGNCGCIAIIENITDIHNGNWICEMVFENGRKVESLAPVQVLVLNCQLSPMHSYKRIKSCEWLSPRGYRINKKNWTDYDVEDQDYQCSIGFFGSYMNGPGKWKCIAHLDEYPENEIYATFNEPNELFKIIESNLIHESWPTIYREEEHRRQLKVHRKRASHFDIEIFIDDLSESQFCTIEGRNGEIFDASSYSVYSTKVGWRFQLFIPKEPEDIVIPEWKILIDSKEGISTTIGAVIKDSTILKEVMEFWHTVPKMEVLKRGSDLIKSYRSAKNLQQCFLESPRGVKYHYHVGFLDHHVSLYINESDPYSCLIMIDDISDEHSGIWYLEMEGEGYRKTRDPLLIQVIKSYFVLESERGMHPDVNIKLHCRRRTIMYDVKIKGCKWFRPDGNRIFSDGLNKYNATKEYDVCTLEIKDPNEDDFGYWKCLASLDGYSDEEIAILNLLQTDITVNKHYKKQEIGKDNGSEGKSSKLRMMIGDAVELICSAPVSNYRDKIEWRYSDSKEVDLPERIKIHELPRSTTHYRSMLSINATLPSDKTFICSTMQRGIYTDTSYDSTFYTIEFRNIPLFFVDTNMNETKWKYNLNITNPEHIILKCYADGLPKPMIVWKRNGMIIENNNQLKTDLCNVTFSNHSQELHIDASDVLCSGLYLCQVRNYIDVKEKYQKIVIEEQKNSTINTITESLFTLLIVLILFLISLILVVCYCLLDRIRLKKKITEVELTLRLNETQLGPLNPEGMLHEQADFLPYDGKRWEYPENDLEMEEQLGHGFFGIVMKAKAPNIHKDGQTPTVAVKKLHSCLRFSNESRALEIELRILANLEKHPNVVNLLGACTEKVSIGHLMVILEYCPLGDLLNYLRRNSSRFIDQIDPLSRTIDFSKKSLGVCQIDSVPGTSQGYTMETSVVMNTDTGIEPENIPIDEMELREFLIRSRNYENASIWDPSIQSTSNMNLYALAPEKKVADNNEDFVSTQNLLEWAYQIACAMEYLSGKKILHGDLAARNVLLAERRVAKVCDFGLARTLPNGHYYKKMDAVMPLKWMAIESIERRKFSTQSDVWSFGIVLWECFTLGKDPYEEMKLIELIALLNSGSRLQMPEYATSAIYMMMLLCWNPLPEDRPSFSVLVHDIGKILNYSTSSIID